ncbi:MAG: nitrogenase molybdenum-iron protein alpha chain [Spirochaetes bacterium]|nr:nitrogenase molybdenum-iron protein alpha chain [Spirochaetota bacterium]
MTNNKENINSAEVKKELLKQYPPKVARKRDKQIVLIKSKNEKTEEIQANVRTIPGIITQRGCCYAGCKGVVLGPTRDIVNLTHGPIGCGFYSWLTRRNQTMPDGPDDENYMTYCFSTDMQEEEIIFGGEKKLKKAIEEIHELLNPKAIGIFSTCPVGLIGDDVHAVAREMSEKTGINIFGFSCEGYKGVSQSSGHHIANNQLFKHIVGLDDTVKGSSKYRINLLGEYNIGGDAFELDRIFKALDIDLVSTFSGNSSYDQFANSHTADLNLVMCHRSINYLADMMKIKFGIPWFKINFIGAEATAKSLRKIGKYFGDADFRKKIEDFIKKEMEEVEKVRVEMEAKCRGRLAMIFVGGSRAHHYQELFKELGMETVGAGYEFAHRDDYEGRRVLPNIQADADSRNIEELTIEKDPGRYNPRITDEKMKMLESEGLTFSEYEGMMQEMTNGSWAIDDISQYETEKMIELYKPAVFCAGIKEKYIVQKMGIPMKQLHSYDYGGPYAGFNGAINFYREIDRMINTEIWKHIEAPWKKRPELHAKYVFAS